MAERTTPWSRPVKEKRTGSKPLHNFSTKLEDVQFAKYLRDAVRHGDVTCSIRIWTHPHVTVGKRYRMEDGEIEIEEVVPITFDEITPELARVSGFASVPDLLRVAQHGRGHNVYLIRFHYVPPQQTDVPDSVAPQRRARAGRVAR